MESSSTGAAGAVQAPPADTPDLKKVGSTSGNALSAGDEAVRQVANHVKQASAEDMQDALDWFMADEDEAEDPTYTVEINISTDVGRPKWIKWTIRPIPSQRIDFLRRTFTMPVNRAMSRRGQQGELDAARFNGALVFEATVDPDLKIPLAQKGFADGSQLVIHRFRQKPLLVDQLAGQVLFYSGGDDEDVRAVRDVRAVKNS